MLEQVYGFCGLVARPPTRPPAPLRGAPPEEVIERVGPLGRAGGFHTDQLPTECVGDATRDLALNGEQIADVVVETFGPKMRVSRRIDQLRVDPDLVAGTPDAALEHIPHPKFAADLLGVHVLVFVREGSVARDDQNVVQAGQVGCQIVGNAVSEVLLIATFAEIGKGQDDDRQPRCDELRRRRNS